MIIYVIKATRFHTYIVAEGKMLHFRDMHLTELILIVFITKYNLL